MPDTLHWKMIFYGLRWGIWLFWENQNKILIYKLAYENHDTEIFNYKKKMIVKFNHVF